MFASRTGRRWAILFLGFLLITGVASLAMSGCKRAPAGSRVFYEFFDPT